MMNDKLSGHLSIAAAYTIFGLNIVFCKDIANSEVVAPEVLFTLRAIGASALFWLISTAFVVGGVVLVSRSRAAQNT